MKKESIHLCDVCYDDYLKEGFSFVFLKSYSFGLNRCTKCNKMEPTREFEVSK